VGALLTGTFADKGVAINRPRTAQNGFNTPKITTKKLLVCAPSNAAVDELVKRFKEGIKTIHGEFQKISVVRLGKTDAIDARVADVTLDYLVDQKLELTSGNKNKAGDEIYLLTQKHKAKTTAITQLREQLDALRAKGESNQEMERRFEIEKRERKSLSDQLDKKRDDSNSIQRDADINRRRIQQEILEGANVICATLSGSGHDMFQNMNVEFETVVIDEAAQSVELSALIPLKYGCSKCILVGDPKQLPPTVLSREASRLQYEQSLFVRMQRNFPDRIHLLDTQYRMHPEISRFPSINFYDGRLLNGPDMAKLRAKPWHAGELLGPYRFFDVQGQQQSAVSGHSMLNMAEVNVAVQLFERLVEDFPKANLKGKVGIITPYRAQLRELRTRFSQKYGESIFETIEFNSTDAYQGRESEIIIFSCVRASNRGIGFVGDIRRMNVGLTRAKSSLWILGNSKALFQNEFWGGLIQDARNRYCYTEGNLIALLQKPSVIKNGNLYQSSSSYNDLEMTDADPAPVDVSRREDMPPKLWPAGGVHGLTETRNCQTCGSPDHSAPYCTNMEAKKASRQACSRCKSVDHALSHCTISKCTTCGNLSHSSNTCTSSKPLKSFEQKGLKKEEQRFEQYKLRAQERIAKGRLGDHDPKVPLIKVASKSDRGKDSKISSKNPSTTGLGVPGAPMGPKRKRGPSPPLSTFKAGAPRPKQSTRQIDSKNLRQHVPEMTRDYSSKGTDQTLISKNAPRLQHSEGNHNGSKALSQTSIPISQPSVPPPSRPIHKIKKRKANDNPMMIPKARTRK
jgi:senataxin